MTERNTHCSYCGAPFAPGSPWPRTCGRCGEVSYVNPVPVAVALLPVGGSLLVIRRSIPPGVGELALPGGFVDLGESWRGAAARELFEETGVRVDPERLELFDVGSAREVLIVFALAPPTTAAALPPSVPTAETAGWELLDGPRELAFPLHTAAAARYFAERQRAAGAGSLR